MSVLTTLGLQESIRHGWPIANLAYIDHPDGEVWLWDGIGSLSYAGNTYIGVGEYGKVQNLGGSLKLGVKHVVFRLSGIPTRMRSFLNADIRNRSAIAWKAGLTEDGKAVNKTAYQTVAGTGDYKELQVESPAVTIDVYITEPVFSIERAQNKVWSSEYFHETFSADIDGADDIPTMQNREENWTLT